MLLFSCKRALRVVAHGFVQRRSGAAIMVGRSRNYSCKEKPCNHDISALGCTTRLSAMSTGSHAAICEDADRHAIGSAIGVNNNKGSPNDPCAWGCPIVSKDGNQGSTEEKHSQAQALCCHGTHLVASQAIKSSPTGKDAKNTPVISCDGAVCAPETSASCPHNGQQGKDDTGASTFKCDQTFCPPERGEQCPLAQQDLPQPRGDQSLAHQLHGGTPETSVSCPHGQQGKDDNGASTFECDRTFCPPEKGEHCPLAQLGLPQPRGDQSLAHSGLHSFKRSLKCPHAYHALFVDAAGTLVHNSQSTEEMYHQIGLKYGVHFSEDEIAAKYKAAYGQPWCRYRMRYEDDGRFFWQCIVEQATGCKDPALLDDLYQYYTTEKAWHIGDPDAEKALKAIRRKGIKLAVVSNFDTRLRPLMRVLQCYDWFDTIVVSAEVGLEKPNPEIFMTACKEVGVKPEQVLHVGDHEINDIVGASAAGCDSLLWGRDVASFAEVAKKLGVEVE